jgi:hypothetical protein
MALPLIGLAIGGSILSGILGGNANKKAAREAKEAGEINAKIAEMQAQDAIDIGDFQANVLRRKTLGLIGEQRVAGAAQGVDISTGSPALLQGESRTLSELDEIMIRANARRAALGLKTQAAAYRKGGTAQAASYNAAATQSYLSGGLNAVQMGFSMRGN